jgi:hypothetical protein
MLKKHILIINDLKFETIKSGTTQGQFVAATYKLLIFNSIPNLFAKLVAFGWKNATSGRNYERITEGKDIIFIL